jgi:hypothetical protein
MIEIEIAGPTVEACCDDRGDRHYDGTSCAKKSAAAGERGRHVGNGAAVGALDGAGPSALRHRRSVGFAAADD